MFDLEQIAIQRADMQLDAERGRHLMRLLRAKWRAQGGAAYFDGIAIDNEAVVWSLDHRIGWRQAANEAVKL